MSIWEATLPNAAWVQQANWDKPNRTDWAAVLDAAIAAAPGPIILAAHSLGCVTSAWWAAKYGRTSHASKVKGALLVAPPDVDDPNFPHCVTGFAPMPLVALPFKSIVVASSDDPWCALPRAQSFALAWGAEFHDIGARGHINGESGLGDWAQGRAWLAELEGSSV